LIVASLRLVNSGSERPIILLIDDLHAEMDETAQKKVYRELLSIDLQLFITNIKDRIPKPLQGKDFKMFHVEHGKISVRKPNQ
jgi:recombinational DNA repair ATPase RecF